MQCSGGLACLHWPTHPHDDRAAACLCLVLPHVCLPKPHQWHAGLCTWLCTCLAIFFCKLRVRGGMALHLTCMHLTINLLFCLLAGPKGMPCCNCGPGRRKVGDDACWWWMSAYVAILQATRIVNELDTSLQKKERKMPEQARSTGALKKRKNYPRSDDTPSRIKGRSHSNPHHEAKFKNQWGSWGLRAEAPESSTRARWLLWRAYLVLISLIAYWTACLFSQVLSVLIWQ